jgi:hypothetical protein
VYRVALPRWEEIVVGAIVGVEELVDCVPVSSVAASPWLEGPMCWVLANPRMFPEALAMRGMQGLFDVPDEVVPTGYR